MIKSIISGMLVLMAVAATAQVQTQVIGDSIHMHSNAGTAELILENNTKSVDGFLYNKGNGRTEFRRGAIKLSSNVYVFGGDTVYFSLSAPPAQNGLRFNDVDRKYEFGDVFSGYDAGQIRPTVYNQNSLKFHWATGSTGIFTVCKYPNDVPATESNPLKANYIARFAHYTQGGLLLESSFKYTTVFAAPQMWINFKNTHQDAKKYSFFGDSIAASIQNGTRTGVDNKVYSILDFGSASDTTYGHTILKLFPAFTAASGGPIRVPTTSIKRLDISNDVAGAMYNLTSLSYSNPYSRLVLDAYNQPLIMANLPTGSGNALVVDGTGKVWRNAASSPSINYAVQSLADAATITWNAANGINGEVTLAGNRTLEFSDLSSLVGHTLTLVVKQDATGSRALALPASCKVVNGGGGALALTTTANAIDIISFYVHSASIIYVSYGKNFN